MLADVKENPATPVFWGKNQSGMQSVEELDDINATIKEYYNEPLNGSSTADSVRYITPRAAAKKAWLAARDNAVKSVEAMCELNLHKQVAVRLLEPWTHITVLLTGTDFENFFALRAHKDAQPEFQKLAYLMLDLYQQNVPEKLEAGQWHIPFGDTIAYKRIFETNSWIEETDGAALNLGGDMDSTLLEYKLKIATARCARVSYLTFEGKDDYNADITLADQLASSGHWSPFEHCAQAMDSSRPSGNFVGWTPTHPHHKVKHLGYNMRKL